MHEKLKIFMWNRNVIHEYIYKRILFFNEFKKRQVNVQREKQIIRVSYKQEKQRIKKQSSIKWNETVGLCIRLQRFTIRDGSTLRTLRLWQKKL